MIYTKESVIPYLDFPFGEFKVFEIIDSTNSYLKENAGSLPDLCVVCAASQSGGRGRLGRSFSSPSGGLYFSILFKDIDIRDTAKNITVCAGVCTADAIRKTTGLDAGIKWVNDVYVNDRKVCGILCESQADASGTCGNVICGIGINYLEPECGFPEQIKDTAAAIASFTTPPDPSRFIAMILNSLVSMRPDFSLDGVISRYREVSVLPGRDVCIIKGENGRIARAVGISDDASLIVRFQNGETESLFYGDVSIKI